MTNADDAAGVVDVEVVWAASPVELAFAGAALFAGLAKGAGFE